MCEWSCDSGPWALTACHETVGLELKCCRFQKIYAALFGFLQDCGIHSRIRACRVLTVGHECRVCVARGSQNSRRSQAWTRRG